MRHSRHRINFWGLLRIICLLSFAEGVFMLVPAVTALIYGERDVTSFLIGIGVACGVGLMSFLLPKPRTRDLGRRDGFVLTALVWMVFSLIGMVPFIISSVNLSVCGAFFESMSGFTTTGASVLSDVESLPRCMHIWRCMMQWIGGVGIILFTVALLPMLNSSGGMQMVNAEVSGVSRDKIQPRVSQTAIRLWGIYSVLTAALCLILWLGPMDFFDSICHAFSTVSTGGYSTSNSSVGAWDSAYVQISLMVFMFLGGLSFVMIYRASLGKVKTVIKEENFRAYVYITLLAALFFMICLLTQGLPLSFDKNFISPLFQSVSMITSTGYACPGLGSWPQVVMPVIIFLMFCGACAGSTSGGVKVDRIVYLWKNARNQLRKLVSPNRVYSVMINGEPRHDDKILNITGFFLLYFAVLGVSGMLLMFMGLGMGDSFFAVFSCLGNTGFGTGATAESFAVVPPAGQILLSVVMLIGRLEFFTVILLLTPAFWRK